MKKYIAMIAIGLACLTAAPAQTVNTNSGTPVLEGPFIDFLHSVSTWTNWGVAGGVIYAPASVSSGGDKGTWGAFATALYNITPFFATGIGIDWLDNQTTMPSGQLQFQAPFTIANKIKLTPFGFTGVAIPVGNRQESDADVVGLFGAGLAAKAYKGLHVFYAYEYRTGEPGPWHLFGLGFSAAF